MVGWKRCAATCGCIDEDACVKAPKNAARPAEQGGFGLTLDVDAIERVPVDEVAFNVACDAASDANHAGLEPQDELKRAIQGYLWAAAQLKKMF